MERGLSVSSRVACFGRVGRFCTLSDQHTPDVMVCEEYRRLNVISDVALDTLLGVHCEMHTIAKG